MDSILEMVKHWLMTPEGTTMIVNWMIGAAGVVGALISTKVIKENKAKERAFQIIKRAVSEVGEEMVLQWKESSKDGKLTSEEKRKAKAAAISKAKEIAMDEGVSLINIVSKEYLPHLIEKAVGEVKSRI